MKPIATVKQLTFTESERTVIAAMFTHNDETALDRIIDRHMAALASNQTFSSPEWHLLRETRQSLHPFEYLQILVRCTLSRYDSRPDAFLQFIKRLHELARDDSGK